MRYKEFGSTGMKVSEMTLGAWGMGGVGWDIYDEETKMDAVKAAVENGINLVDTAPAYNAGASERFLGRTFQKLGIRKEMQISTKCGNIFVDGQYIRQGGYDKILEQCDQSLKNLQTDYVDLMLVHWPDPKVELSETMSALARLKKEGKILHIGVSNFSIDQIKEARTYAEVEVIQPHYSMVFRDQEDILRFAADLNMGVMTYGSLGGGILTGAYRELQEFAPSDSRNRFYKHFKEPMFSKVQELLKVMDQVSADNDGMPLAQIALNWSVSKPFVSTCIVGAQTRAKVLQNTAAFDRTLSQEDLDRLDEAIRTCLA